MMGQKKAYNAYEIHDPRLYEDLPHRIFIMSLLPDLIAARVFFPPFLMMGIFFIIVGQDMTLLCAQPFSPLQDVSFKNRF